VERLKKARRDSGAAPATANRAVAMLKHACGLWAQWGWMPATVATSVRGVKLLKEPPGRVRYLTADEERAILGAIAEGVRPIAVAALLSGMRLSEARLLRKDAVDLDNRTITLTKTKANRVRRVPINVALEALLEGQGVLRSGAAGPETRSEYVFPARTGKPYQRHSVSRAWRRACQTAGIADLRFHDTRHHFATEVRRRGGGIDAIQALLGHATIQMATRYAHIEMDSLRDAVAGLSIGQPLAIAPATIRGNLREVRR
jgi:integrase